MALKDLTEKARELMPWNWGKRPVRVRDERTKAGLPAVGEDFHCMFENLFEDFFVHRFADRSLAPFAEPTRSFGTDWPRVDLEETDRQFELTAEVPGMDADDLKVTVDNNRLTIEGSKTTRREQRERDCHLMETHSGSFRRIIPLPLEVSQDGVEAHCKNGQLTVILPKTAASRSSAKRIELK